MDDGASSYHRFLQGDTAALETLVKLYSDDIVRYAYCYVHNSAVAEDIMENAFAALIVKRKKFAAKASFKAYLFRIARNACIDYLRKNRNSPVPLGDVENVLRSEQTENEVFKNLRNEKIYACIQRLYKDYREVIFLTYFNGLSVEEIKTATGKSVKQIYNLLARARTALKEILIKEGISYEDI